MSDFEPPFPDPHDWPRDEEPYEAYETIALPAGVAVDTNRFLDASTQLGLFDGVLVDEISGTFRVPERQLRTKYYGMWLLNVYGRAHIVKEPKDLGDQRCTADGLLFWAPSLYPFEETDHRGLPMIRDQQRASLMVELTSPSQNPYPIGCYITSGDQEYVTGEDIAYHNPSGIRHFEIFNATNQTLHAVDKPISGTSAGDYESRVAESINIENNLNEQIARVHLHYEDQSVLKGKAFGRIMVPLALLPEGNLQASVFFPELSENE